MIGPENSLVSALNNAFWLFTVLLLLLGGGIYNLT